MNMEFTFREFEIKTSALKMLKNQAYIALVLLESVQINKQVIEIGNLEIVKIFSESVIDKVLKVPGALQRPKGITWYS